MKKIMSIFGTRPEAIKMAPVVQELEHHEDQFLSRVCVTAQHREMLDQVLDLFGIKPDYDLDLMRENQTLSGITARVFRALDPILENEQPDWILVQGDTTTVMAASLVGFYHRTRVGHVEAGLRTHDKWRPFPEEVNRKIAGVVADLHFAPTTTAKENLLSEGVNPESIHVTGNPVIDALLQVSGMPFEFESSQLREVPWDKKIILLTAHRRENFGKPLRNICRAVQAVAEKFRDQVHFVYPVHLNPHVWDPVHRQLGDVGNVTLLQPLDYLPLVHLMKRSTLVLTDSGGIQEEAPGLGIPVLVLREKTERPEAVRAGTVELVGTDVEAIYQKTVALLENSELYHSMAHAVNPYGDGTSAERIVNILSNVA